MDKYILAYDLGTSGNKVVIYDIEGRCIDRDSEAYNTFYPSPNFHEQKPCEWWNSFVVTTKRILSKNKINKKNIKAIVVSGHSLGCVLINKDGNLLVEKTPIWSDTRPVEQAKNFFKKFDETEWYKITGNGFARECYPVFKLLWYKDNYPYIFNDVHKVIGTKDYINYRLTGKIFTDYSYASGSGVYDLLKWGYSNDLIKESGLSIEIFPEIVPSSHFVGNITKEASNILGINNDVKVLCGGVDNSCMALGSRNITEGRIYVNLGSSAWIAISSYQPFIDIQTTPFVFAHVIPKMFTSSFGTFSAGSSFKWIKENISGNIFNNINTENLNAFEIMEDFASKSPVGSNKVIFNPSLAGGSKAQPSPNIRGAFVGLRLSNNLSDLIRSSMEGIAMDLKFLFDKLNSFNNIKSEVLLVGGGSKSKLWSQIIADIFNRKIIKTNVGQDATALGAAAIAAVSLGFWKDFNKIDEVHKIESSYEPLIDNVKKYKQLLKVYDYVRSYQAKIGDLLQKLDL